MIKLRYYCSQCLERREAEIILRGNDNEMFVKSTGQPVICGPAPGILMLDGELRCPLCGKDIIRYKIIRDPPERIVGQDGKLRYREYKD